MRLTHMKTISIPSQLLKWQPRILTVGENTKINDLLTQIKWRNYDKTATYAEAVIKTYDSFLTPNPVNLILIEEEMIEGPNGNFLDLINKDHHFSNTKVVLIVSEANAIKNIVSNKKYPHVSYHLLNNNINEINLAIALSESLLTEDISAYRQNKLIRNLLMNDLFKDHYRKKSKWAFRPFFQKLVNISTNEIEGYELLMRWKRKNKEVPPDQFIRVAEKNGIIRYLDQRALEFAAEYCESFYKQDIFMTVNVSPLNLENIEYFYFLKKIVKKIPHFAQVVRLEITETAIINNLRNLLRIKKLGFKIIMDDFGKDMANLGLFYQLASKKIIQKVKIDKDFFQSIIKDHLSGKFFLVKLIQMLNVAGVEVLIEGIENEIQYQILQNLNLPLKGQGYHLGRPEVIEV